MPNVTETMQLDQLSSEQLIAILGMIGKSPNDSLYFVPEIESLSQRRNAVNKKLDRAVRDVEAKASDLARFYKADYKPLTDSSVHKYTVWRTRFLTQVEFHGLGHYSTPDCKDHYVYLIRLWCNDQVFEDQPLLLEKYEYLLNKIDELVSKQITFVKTVFERKKSRITWIKQRI